MTLVYLEYPDCYSCQLFEPHWEALDENLLNVKKVHILVEENDPRLPILTKEYYWYPMILLFRQEDYQKYFDGPKLREDHPSEPLPSSRYGSVEEDGKFIWSGREMTVWTITEWVKKEQLK